MTKEELFAIAERNHDVRISISQGFELFKKNIGGFIGIVVINILISWALSLIPFAGGILSYFIGSFLTAGMILVFKKIKHGEEHQFNDFFEVLKNPAPFLLFLLVQFLMLVAVAIPAIALFFSLFYTAFSSGTFDPQAMGMTVTIFLGMLLAILPVLFLGMCYVFSIHIFLFLNQDFWVALETSRKLVMKNFLSVLSLLIVVALAFIFFTLVTCGLGYFVMLPVSVATIYIAFDNIFKPSSNSFDTKVDSFGTHQRDLNTEADEKTL